MSYIGDLLYPLHAAIHSTPRVLVLSEAIEALKVEYHFSRILDVGCGHGLLSRYSREWGFDYVGVDPCNQLIKKARKANPSSKFFCNAADELPFTINKSDIAVINGAVHHLSPEVWLATKESLKEVGSIIILDHRRDSEFDSRSMLVPRLMQWCDRGKFIRNLAEFESLDGFSVVFRRCFEIYVLGMRFWPYFCHAYVSRSLCVNAPE